MEVLRLNDMNLEACAARAAEVLRAGGVVLYPTDTLYGLGADALSDDAVAKVIAIKGRDEGKPIHAIVPDIAMASAYAEVTGVTRTLMEKFPKGLVTYILKKKEGYDTGVTKKIGTFGFRIPDNEFCIAMVRAFGGPVTATSANRSGAPQARRIPDILTQLGTASLKIDLGIDAGELPERKPSTVVDLSSARLAIVREGAVSASEIASLLGMVRRI